MRIEKNKKTFDRMQVALLREIIRTVHRVLETKGLSKARVKDIVEDVVFHLTAVLDGSAEVELDDALVIPRVAFQGTRRGVLVTEPGGSWMHEYAFGLVAEVLSEGESSTSAAQPTAGKGAKASGGAVQQRDAADGRRRKLARSGARHPASRRRSALASSRTAARS